MKIIKLSTCEYKPKDSISKIDSETLIEDVLNLHYNDFDTLSIEESDLPERIREYYWYNLKLIPINSIKYIDSIEDSLAEINEQKVEKYSLEIEKTKSYPPIVVDILFDIIDGYHRVFALKKLNCNKIWAYVPDKSSKNTENEEIEEE